MKIQGLSMNKSQSETINSRTFICWNIEELYIITGTENMNERLGDRFESH